MKNLFWVVLVLGACSKAETTKSPSPEDPGVGPRKPEIAVEVAGVTLAEDCGDGANTKPIPPPPGTAAGSSSQPSPSASQDISAGACAPGMKCGGIPAPACEQTAMQLALHVPMGATQAKLAIKKAELLDDTGKSVGVLATRTPSTWNGSAYVAWDEMIPAGKSELVVSYKLAAPDWNTLTNGRWNAPSKRFRLRLTVTVGDREHTVEKQSITPATPEPMVST